MPSLVCDDPGCAEILTLPRTLLWRPSDAHKIERMVSDQKRSAQWEVRMRSERHDEATYPKKKNPTKPNTVRRKKTIEENMGGATSRFAETDWENASAGVKETIDGSMPSEDLSILTLKKKNSVVDQRSLEISNDMDELLYSSKSIVGSAKGFDLYSAIGEKLFCVHTDALHEKWTIFSYKPVWEDQQAEANIFGTEKIYRKARIDIAYGKSHGEVFPYIQDWEHDTDFKGVLSVKSLLKVEEIQSKTAQFQSYIPQAALKDNALVHPALCGWWVWENTRNRHQIKMHLIKDSDIALHCIVAITTNLVHIEKESVETAAQVLGH